MNRALVLGGPFLLLLLVACSSTPLSNPDDRSCEELATAPHVAVHDGVSPYEPLAAGDLLDVEYGLQGGMHARLAVSCAGLDPGSPTLSEGLKNDDLPRVTWTVIADNERLSNETPRRAVALQPTGDRTLLEPHVVVLRYFESPPNDFDRSERQAELEQSTTTVQVEVTDHCERSASASLEVRLRFPRDAG